MEGDQALWLADRRSGELERLVWLEEENPTIAQRGSSYATDPVWSSDGKLLWFGLTKAQKQPLDEDRMKNGMEPVLSEAPESKREQMRRIATEHASWAYSHWVGIMDFTDRKVWFTEACWTNVAWSPTLQDEDG